MNQKHQGPVLIVDGKGIYPDNLDEAIEEQRRYHKEASVSKMVFVFGSNTAGIHGAGAAQTAYEKHGARMGHGYGYMWWKKGGPHSFAIPTKDRNLKTLPVERIEQFVQGFLAFAAERQDLTFQVTRIGCGLAGLDDYTMAPMFLTAHENCLFDEAWKPWLLNYVPKGHGGPYVPRHYWGTF